MLSFARMNDKTHVKYHSFHDVVILGDSNGVEWKKKLFCELKFWCVLYEYCICRLKFLCIMTYTTIRITFIVSTSFSSDKHFGEDFMIVDFMILTLTL